MSDGYDDKDFGRIGEVLAELNVLVVCIGPDGRPARIPDYVRGVLPRMTQSE